MSLWLDDGIPKPDELAIAVEAVWRNIGQYVGPSPVVVTAERLRLILSRLASQEETIRADGEALKFYSLHWISEPNGDSNIPGDADGWITEPADTLLADGGRKARARLSARQEGK